MSTVFLSYAKEDVQHAERLYMDLRRAELDVWMDKKCLLPGQDWQHEIAKAIKHSTYFLALVSKRSLGKRGYVQKEMKLALEVLAQIPKGDIYLIPARLDDSVPSDEQLTNLNWVDLFPSYGRGVQRLMAVFSKLERAPLHLLDPMAPSTYRAPIEFTPFRTFDEFVGDLLGKVPASAHFHDRDYSYFISYRTDLPGVVLPKHVRAKYPKEITVVLREGYKSLNLDKDTFSVNLMFDGVWENLVVPYSAVTGIHVPEIELLIVRLKGGVRGAQQVVPADGARATLGRQ